MSQFKRSRVIAKPLNYQILFNASPDLYMILDPDLNIIEVSDAYSNATFIKRKDVLNRNIFSVFPDNPNDPQATGVNNLRSSLLRVLENKTPDTMAVQKYDVRLPEAQGGKFVERHWSVINVPVLDENNNVLYIIHRAEDVTEYIKQKQLTEELKTHSGKMQIEITRRAQEIQDANNKLRSLNTQLAESELRARLLIEASKEYAIFMLDPKGFVKTWNSGAENIKGYKPEEIIGKHFSCFYPPELIASHHPEQELEMALKNGRFEEVGWRVRKNGEKFWANVVITPLYDDKNKLIGFGKITRDLTEQKRIESMKDEFISVVSHELRTPLTSIQGSLSLLLGGALGKFNEKVTKLIEIANNNCMRLMNLVNDILDIQKISAGKVVFDFKTIELAKLVKDSIDANTMYAEKFGVKMRLIEPLPNIKVNVDSKRLMQVLANLISNAIKFSESGGTVTIEVTEHDKNVRVNVKDTGKGIPKEFQSKIFEKFTQADASDKRSIGGSGLGLAISKAIMENMGGDLAFTSKVNHGSCFYFDLPIWQKDSPATPIIKARKQSKHTKILICEDDESQAEFLSACLQAGGFDTDIASTAAIAKKKLSEESYLGMCLDLLLPDQDGISLIKEIRTNTVNPNLPIIVVSVIAKDSQEIMNGEIIEVVDWLDKPIDIKRLLKAFNNIKKRSKKPLTRILHVEDDIDAQRLISTLLLDNAQVVTVASIAEAKELLTEQRFDLAILDLLLADGNGIDLLPQLSKANIPVVIFARGELDKKYAGSVQAVLRKDKTNPNQLLQKIKTFLDNRK